jgi:hypothetical protein
MIQCLILNPSYIAPRRRHERTRGASEAPDRHRAAGASRTPEASSPTPALRSGPFRLNQNELAELISEVRSAVVSELHNKPAPDRRPHLLSTILFPIEELPQHGTDESADPRP